MKRDIFQNNGAEWSENLTERERLVEMGSAAAIFAHEIANPLAAIQLAATAIEDKIPAQHQHLFDTLCSEVERAGRLLEQFRSLRTVRDLSLVSLDLVDVVHRVVELNRPLWAEKGIRTISRSPENLGLRGDADKLQQVVINLCKNAVESMPTGGTLTLTGYREGKTVILDVNDTGPGIPEGIDVFKPFTSTKSHGTGLGLYIVQQIVEAHRGVVQYSSHAAQGTTFRLTLPTEMKVCD
jgi:two-component system sensor histidine kinase HydH